MMRREGAQIGCEPRHQVGHEQHSRFSLRIRNGSNNTNAGTVAFGLPNVVSSNNVVGKVDYHASDHHTFAATLAREISGGVLRAALKAMR